MDFCFQLCNGLTTFKIDGFVKLIWFSYALQNWSFFCEKIINIVL